MAALKAIVRVAQQRGRQFADLTPAGASVPVRVKVELPSYPGAAQWLDAEVKISAAKLKPVYQAAGITPPKTTRKK